MAAVSVLPGAVGTSLIALRGILRFVLLTGTALALLPLSVFGEKTAPPTPEEIEARVQRTGEETAAREKQARERQADRDQRAREAEERRAAKARRQQEKEEAARKAHPGTRPPESAQATPGTPDASGTLDPPERAQARRQAEIDAAAATRKASREADEARYREYSRQREEERRRREERFAENPPKAPNLERNPF